MMKSIAVMRVLSSNLVLVGFFTVHWNSRNGLSLDLFGVLKLCVSLQSTSSLNDMASQELYAMRV